MKSGKKKILLPLVAAVSITAVAITGQDASTPRQSQERDNYPHLQAPPDASPEKLKKFKERLGRTPVADYDAVESAEPEKQAKRLAKNRTYNHGIGKESSKLRWVELGVIHNDWEFGLDSAIPVAQSTAVVVGDVSETRAFVSEDKTNVYSEFVVRVEEVIKDDPNEPIVTGKKIVTERWGGRIRFPQGGVSTYVVAGQFMPEEGKKYIFFLGHNRQEAGPRNPGAMNRHILTAYELSEGTVLPLDSAGGMFKPYEGKDAASFLTEVRRAHVVSSTTPR